LGAVGEALAALTLIGVPVVFVVVFVRLDMRARAEAFAIFRNDMAVRGFPMREGSAASSWSVRGEIAGGVPVAIEPYTVRTGTGKRAQNRAYTAVRIEAPTALSRMGIYESSDVPLTELGAMREQSLPPAVSARYRAFAERTEDAAVWSTREAQELLLQVGTTRSMETTSGALVLVLEGHPESAALLLRAAELLAAIHARRSIAAAPPPKARGSESPWLVPAFAPIFLSIFLGVPLGCAPPILDAASPIACERGHIVNRHTNKNPLRCVDSEGRQLEDAHLIPILLGMSASYYPLMILCALWAGLKRTKKEDENVARPGGSAYR
jgi:hypothetical protein